MSPTVAAVVDSDAFGGAEVYTRRLWAWSRLPRRLLVTEPVAERFAAQRPVVVPLARHRAAAPDLAGALAGLRPDVVHLNLVDPASNAAALRAALSVAPTVATLHLGGDPGDGRLRPLYRSLAAAIAPSVPIARQLCELGVPAARVRHIGHGVPLPPEPPPAPPRRPVVIGTVARLTTQKGLDLLLDAVRELVRRGREVRLVVAGDGRDRAALHRRAEGLPVEFLGWVADVSPVLRGLDVFCLPSRREALSLALLEAAAHGLACVATEVGDTGRLGDAVLLVPPEHPGELVAALDRVVTDRRLRVRLGARARSGVQRDFPLSRWVSRTEEVLIHAAPRPPRPARRPPRPARR